MRRNTIISILMAGLLAVSAAGCRSVPSDSELEKALEEGTITFEDAKSRGWVDDAWLEEHFPPIEAGSKIHSFPPFEMTYLDGTPASSQLIEGTMCLVFFDSTQGDTVEKLREVSGISGEMARLGALTAKKRRVGAMSFTKKCRQSSVNTIPEMPCVLCWQSVADSPEWMR